MAFLLPLAFTILWSAAFTRYSLGGLVFVALIPLLYFLDSVYAKRLSRPKLVFLVWLSGFVAFLTILAWLASLRPGTWAGIDESVPVVFVILTWLVSALAMSVGPFVFILIVSQFKQIRLDNPKVLLLWPAAWVAGEYIASWLFSVVWYNASATLGPHWHFGSLGLGAASTHLVMLSRFIGLYGLSCVVVICNILVFWLIKRRFRPAIYGFGILILLLIGATVTSRTSETASLTVGAVQLRDGQQGYNAELANLIQQKGAPGLDVAALPEYANFLSGEGASGVDREALNALFQGKAGVAVETRSAQIGDSQDNQRADRTFYYDQAGRQIAAQDKSFLIPNGEYLTNITRWMLSVSRREALMTNFERNRAIIKAPQPERVIDGGRVQIGSLACSGIMSPELYRRLAQQGADVLINDASLEVFPSDQYFEQAKALARFDAVANNRPFVQAARDGYSYIITSNGSFAAETTHRDMDYIFAEVSKPSRKTLYSYIGEPVLAVSFAVLLGFLVSDRKTKRHKTTPAKKKN